MRQAIKGHKRLGHGVRLMLPQYVKPYIKRGKNDATDAEAIYEAVTHPSMRFVPIKGTENNRLHSCCTGAETSWCAREPC